MIAEEYIKIVYDNCERLNQNVSQLVELLIWDYDTIDREFATNIVTIAIKRYNDEIEMTSNIIQRHIWSPNDSKYHEMDITTIQQMLIDAYNKGIQSKS